MRRDKINVRTVWLVFGMLLGSVAGVWMAAQEPPPNNLRCGNAEMETERGFWICLTQGDEELCRIQRPVCKNPTNEVDLSYPMDCWVSCCDYRYRCGEILCCCSFITAWKKCKREDGRTICYACGIWKVKGHKASSCNWDGECVTASGTP